MDSKQTNYFFAAIAIIAVLALAWGNVGKTTPKSDFSNQSVVGNSSKNNSQNSSITYTDSKFGYQLTLPAIWRGYKAVNITAPKELLQGTSGLTEFCIPTTDQIWMSGDCPDGFAGIFSVTAYTPAQWAAANKESTLGGPGLTLLGRTAKYYFAYSHGNDVPLDIIDKNLNETAIFDSFKAIE